MPGIPLKHRLKVGIPAMAKIFTMNTDQATEVYDAGDYYIYTSSPCPMCWGYRTDQAACQLGQGLLQQGTEWVSGGKKFQVEIESCVAKGDDIGRYRIYKEPLD